MRICLNLTILALDSIGLGVVAARHVPDLVAGVGGILGFLFAAALICAGLVAERKV